jgi:glyoxylase-like metal-dependent hydrolase (beta-lactamase superfamily II)
VDPHEEDVDAYRAFADAKGMRITHVIDTHVHADHRSGGRALAARTGAAYCLHRSADVSFAFEPLEDRRPVEIGNTIILPIHTPGHTPESVCLVVSDLRRSPEPWFVLTGDTLFVGAVGRPDLPGQTEKNAAELYRSLQQLGTLPDTIEVYPAHFSGSSCGAGLSGKPSTTLGFEKRWNPLLGLSRDELVRQVSHGIPPKPTGMDAIVRFNQGRGA